jgi:hypothetical protein
MGVRGNVNQPHLKHFFMPIPMNFHADSNEFLCVLIALVLMEILVDFDRG